MKTPARVYVELSSQMVLIRIKTSNLAHNLAFSGELHTFVFFAWQILNSNNTDCVVIGHLFFSLL